MLSANVIDSAGCSRLPKGIRARRCATGLPCRARCAVSSLRAGIPRAYARWRSLRAALATEETGSTPVVTFYGPTPCSSLNPAKRRGPPLRFGLSQGPGRARAKIQARAACLGRAVKVADREVGLRELSTASCEAHRPLKRGAGASAQRSLPPATQSKGCAPLPPSDWPPRCLPITRLRNPRHCARGTTRARRLASRCASQARRAPTSAPTSATFRTDSRPRHPGER